jgi:hypothetical protein
VTPSRDAQGLGLTADAVRYLRALLRRSVGSLGHCNSHSECGYSLADLILSYNGKKFVKEGYRSLYQNRIAIEKGIKKDWNCEE